MTGMLFAGTGSADMTGVAAGMCMAGALGQNGPTGQNATDPRNTPSGRSGFFDGANINATLVGWAGKLEEEEKLRAAGQKEQAEQADQAAEPVKDDVWDVTGQDTRAEQTTEPEKEIAAEATKQASEPEREAVAEAAGQVAAAEQEDTQD